MSRRKRTRLMQILQKDLKEFRRRQWLKQNKRCAACQKKIPFEKSVVDHAHKRKKDPAGVDGKGKIRGVLHFGVNALEGKIANAYVRYGLKNIAPLPDILRGIANFLEDPPVTGYLHPSCIPKNKRKRLNITDIKRVLKYWSVMYPKKKKPVPTKRTTKRGNVYYTTNKQWEGYVTLSKELAKGTSNGVRCTKKQKARPGSKSRKVTHPIKKAVKRKRRSKRKRSH